MGITGILFTLGFFALLGMAFIKHPRYGVYAYLAAFYVHPPSRWWGAGLPNMRWALLASVVMLITVWRMPNDPARPSWASTTPAKLLIVFTVWVWIQFLWAMDTQMQFDLAVLYTKYVVLFYLIYRICSTPEEIEYFLLAHVIGCFYLGYLAFGDTGGGRLEGVGGPGIDEANALGMQLATAVMCGAMTVLIERRWKLLVISVAMAFILNGIVLTGSRGSFLSVICGGFCLLLMKPKEHKKLFYALAVMGFVLFGLVANKSFWERIGTMEAAVSKEQEMDTSAESRLVVAEAQVKMALRYPWGTGHRGTEVLSREYVEEKYLTRQADGSWGARSSHNSFLSAWVEQGVPGAVIFIWTVLWCRRASQSVYKQYQSDRSVKEKAQLASVTAALLVVLIAGIFVDYLKSEVTIWMLTLLAVMHSREVGSVMQKNPLTKNAVVGSVRNVRDSRPTRS